MSRIGGLLVAGLVVACAPHPTPEAQKRYFWPPSAEYARIEYLGYYAGAADLRRDHISWVDKYILGIEPSPAVFKKPFAVDARFGKVAVTDTTAHQVILLDLARKTIEPLAMRLEDKANAGAQAGGAERISTTGIAFAGPDELWLADSWGGNVYRCGLDGRDLGRIGHGHLTRPTAVAVDHVNRRAVVVDTPKHRLALFDLDGTFLGELGERGVEPGQFNYPLDADFDSAGDLYVLDAFNARVQRFRWDGGAYRYVLHFGERGMAAGSFQMPKALAVTPAGHIYITDSMADKVTVFDRDGTFLLTFGGRFVAAAGRVSPGGLNMPAGIAADEHDGIWIADTLNGMIHHFQYLDEAYLRAHPILPEQVVLPSPGMAPAKSDAAPTAEGK